MIWGLLAFGRLMRLRMHLQHPIKGKILVLTSMNTIKDAITNSTYCCPCNGIWHRPALHCTVCITLLPFTHYQIHTIVYTCMLMLISLSHMSIRIAFDL